MLIFVFDMIIKGELNTCTSYGHVSARDDRGGVPVTSALDDIILSIGCLASGSHQRLVAFSLARFIACDVCMFVTFAMNVRP